MRKGGCLTAVKEGWHRGRKLEGSGPEAWGAKKPRGLGAREAERMEGLRNWEQKGSVPGA